MSKNITKHFTKVPLKGVSIRYPFWGLNRVLLILVHVKPHASKRRKTVDDGVEENIVDSD